MEGTKDEEASLSNREILERQEGLLSMIEVLASRKLEEDKNIS